MNESAALGGLNPGMTYDYRIVARNESGTSYGSNRTLTTLPSPPTVTSVAPTAGLESGGTSVAIAGTGLGETTAVLFGSAPATSFHVNSSSSLTAIAPEGMGSVDVTVVAVGGSSEPVATDLFTYVAPGPSPAVTKLSVKKGPATGGTSIAITGTSFAGVTSVKFGSVPAASYEVHSASSITAVSPAGTTGMLEVHVSTPNGQSAITSRDHFMYEAPTVTHMAPSAGSKLGGTSVTIKGSGFALGSETVFKFGKGIATGVNCASSSECTMQAPAAAKTGTVDVRATVGKKTSKKLPPNDQFTYD